MSVAVEVFWVALIWVAAAAWVLRLLARSASRDLAEVRAYRAFRAQEADAGFVERGEAAMASWRKGVTVDPSAGEEDLAGLSIVEASRLRSAVDRGRDLPF